jgi:hypothetical protein
MFNNKLQKQVDDLSAAVKLLTQTQQKNLNTIEDLQVKVEKLTAVSAQVIQRHELKNSDIPYIDIISQGEIDPDKGLPIQLDWNDAFIAQLRAQGYKGTSEGSLVAQYLLNLGNGLKNENESAG